MEDKDLEILKELSETRDCSIHWYSTYNIALRNIYEWIMKNRGN